MFQDLIEKGLVSSQPGFADDVLSGFGGISPKTGGGFFKSNTFRDILGGVGDVLMLNSGMKPMYTDWRDNQMIGDALQNFDKDPMGTIAEVSRLDRNLGGELLQRYQTSVAAAQAARATAENQLRDDNRAVENEMYNRWKDYAPGAFATAASASDQKSWDRMRPWLINFAKKYNQELDPSLIEEQFSPELQMRLKNFAISPTAQAQMAATDARAAAGRAISQGNLDVRRAEAGKRRKVDSYTNEEGRNVVVYDDGTEEVGGKVRPTSNRRSVVTTTTPANPSTPATKQDDGMPPPRRVGDRIKDKAGNVLYSRDGKTWSNL
jgi:hypothetical protein